MKSNLEISKLGKFMQKTLRIVVANAMPTLELNVTIMSNIP